MPKIESKCSKVINVSKLMQNVRCLRPYSPLESGSCQSSRSTLLHFLR